MGESLYAYGVIEQEELELEIEGVEGAERAYTVDCDSISVLVSDIDTVEVERTDENVRAHAAVLQDLLQHDGGRTIVPMGFGMAFKDESTLENLFRQTQSTFVQALDELEGTVELGLKVVVEGDGNVDRAAIEEDVASRFDELAVDATENDQFSDRLVVNRSFLVERDNQDAFNSAVAAFEADHEDLLVEYSGPWPPYNFVEIKIGAQPQ